MSDNERRREDRRRCSDPIWWRAEQRDDYRVGWLLERSSCGAAFVVRDAWPPNVTDLLEVHVWHGPDDRRRGRGFVVHRVRPIHADLYLVAGRFAPLEGAGEQAGAAQVEVRTEADEPVALADAQIEHRPLHVPVPAAIWQG